MKSATDIKIKGDLGGTISVKLKHSSAFNDYCAQHIENYNPDRFEALAVKVYYGKETTVTLFAIDKERQEGNNFSPGKIPVKKFKLDIRFVQDMLPHIKEFNFTLSTDDYPLEDMEVINI